MDDTLQLAKLMRLVLGGATEGERLAAIEAFRRAMESQDLDLHDIADRVGGADHPGHRGDDGEPLDRDTRWRMVERIAKQTDDDAFPPMAAWLIQEDDGWHAAHGRYLLTGKQRAFVNEMREHAEVVRLTLRQATWLMALVLMVTDQLARPHIPPSPRIGEAPPARPKPQRHVRPSRPPPAPRRIHHREEQLAWIATITSAQGNDGAALFSDAEVRLLAWLAATHKAWEVDDKLVTGTPPPSATAMAASARVSLRTARRALSKAITSGYLIVARQGRGRGRTTTYLLAQPPDRWRAKRPPAAPHT